MIDKITLNEKKTSLYFWIKKTIFFKDNQKIHKIGNKTHLLIYVYINHEHNVIANIKRTVFLQLSTFFLK